MIEPFLQSVAQDLYNKIGNNLSRTALIFPNKRAILFFNEYIADVSEGPVWSPAAMSISDLFQQLSALQAGDPIRLVCELYKIFKEETQSNETLDDFYFWGELLIGDFDDVDKNLVEANKLFVNLQDLKEMMDDYQFLDAEKEEAIRQFFQNFSIERRTLLKEKFISLWERLGCIYERYRTRLVELGMAYEGMLYRDAVERLNTTRLAYDRYVFVGFNVLSRVELELFRKLQSAGKALFYWDYDLFYTHRIPRHEAGTFLLRNLREFPNELPEAYFDAFRTPKKIRYIAAATENAQARFLAEWYKEIATSRDDSAPTDEKQNAVVLCNEALLLPVLHSLPQEVKHVNVTMGFPLAQTPIFSFLNAAMELQTDGYRTDTGRFLHEQVATLLKHPYTRRLSAKADEIERALARSNRFYPLPSELQQDEFLSLLFAPCTGHIKILCEYLLLLIREVSAIYREEDAEQNDIFNQLYREALFQSYLKVNRLYSLIESGALSIQMHTFKKLLAKIFAAANIPFHGEPAIGMQIMGVLETRNLDFRNLLLLSLNEGKLPKAGGSSSFIPYNLRKAFGMTTIEHENAVYAYYFYRLIQRAESITMLYNTSSDGLNKNEESRFMLQLLVEGPHDIRREYLEAGLSAQNAACIRVEKSTATMQRLYRAYDATRPDPRVLSPSALNTYIDCRLKFYYRYVAGLKPKEEVSSKIDSALFGTIFHYAAELLYTDLTAHGKIIGGEELKRLLHDDARIQDYVDQAFKEKFFQTEKGEKAEYNGTQLIRSKVIVTYLKQLLRKDLQYAPFTMIAMEKPVHEEVAIATAKGPFTLKLGGTIDRMDAKEDVLRIVDYKTGGKPKTAVDIEQLFTPAEDRPSHIFQTFLYAAILCRQQSLKVAPALLYIHQAATETYSPIIEMKDPHQKGKMQVENFALFEEEFRGRLQLLLEEIFDEVTPFTQTEETQKCSYCDFRDICRR